LSNSSGARADSHAVTPAPQQLTQHLPVLFHSS
jgi:hypothetical protein